jgi:hypothetical protein
VAGWWDPRAGDACKGGWIEDYRHVSTSAGDTAWSIIALSALFDKTGDERYRTGAVRLGQWVRDFCRRAGDPAPGFTGGTEGWPPKVGSPPRTVDPDSTGLSPVQKRKKYQEAATYRSTEMNLDLAVAMYHLARITGDKSWESDSAKASQYVISKFDVAGDSTLKHFLAGDGTDFRHPDAEWKTNREPGQLPLDTNSWAVLVFGRTPQTEEGMHWAEKQCCVENGAGGFSGFAFSPADRSGVWSEGTGQAVVAYRLLGEDGKADRYLHELERIQAASPDGGMVAATRDGLFTGFKVRVASRSGPAETEWRYFAQNHLAALAWLIFAEQKWNPYYQIPAASRPPTLPGTDDLRVKQDVQK